MVTLIMVTVTWFLTLHQVEAAAPGGDRRGRPDRKHHRRFAADRAPGWVGYQAIIDRQMEVNEDLVFIAVYDEPKLASRAWSQRRSR